ncbi:threonine-phosphate decarboxylase [Roseibium aquae]|uniref:threonine-phosphate decarboxylase n=2 Tax=Roseibium aquae TaxID=1323746 RepID=A0A916X194_9HYPH|nr:threonine-phosphate decarboxylase CobD [Roseibium aquae]GGB54615.1 threonine-phosphate decarboxylase [Roseibium aquae]
MLHGGDLPAACETYGGIPAGWLDLSTGINPHAYPLPDNLPAEAWTRLPSQDALDRLLSAARAAYRVPPHLGLAAAPGTQALITLLPELLPDGEVALAAPTYGTHKMVWERAGRCPVEVSSVYALPATARIVVLVNPNNPDGRLVDGRSLLDIAQTLKTRNGTLIIDEAFADVMPGASLLPNLKDEPVVVLRSFGKFFGLAGLRLGFMAGPSDLVREAAVRLESWAVSGPALDIGRTALADLDWQSRIARQLSEEIGDLQIVLMENGLGVVGGTPLFALASLRQARALHQALARRHVWTRVFDYAPTWIRIGLPGSKDNLDRFADALAEAMKEI